MQRLTIFGKGGIGKSTLAANFAAVYARRGLRVLLVGCDPKHDTTVALTDGRPIRTVVEQSLFMDSACGDSSQFVVRGRLGVDCVEAGGPEPGIGCAGRGISRMIELMEGAGMLREDRYDVALFDVLGDVVCGGFAAPLRQGFADKVVIVASEELMALYAANNIARAIRNYSANGVALCGLVANLRDLGADRQAMERFAGLIGTRVLAFLRREPAVREAEYRHTTVVEHAPKSEISKSITALAEELLSFDRSKTKVPTPLSDESFHELSREAFSGEGGAERRPEEAPRRGPGPAALTSVAPRQREGNGSVTAQPPPNGKFALPRGEGVGFVRGGPEQLHGSHPGAAAGRPADVEKELAWQASLWESNPGPNSQVWGASDQWRRFFCDFETRRHSRTRLEVSAPVIHVWHQDLECSYATPDYHDPSLPSFFKFPWPRLPEQGGQRGEEGGPEFRGDQEWPPSPSKRPEEKPEIVREAMTNLKDLDIIHGGGRKLDAALDAALQDAEGRVEAVIVHSTCVPTVIGDDAEAVVARWQGRTKVPIVYTNPAQGGQDVDVGLVLFEKMRQDPSFAKVSRRPKSVNLVGFPEGPGLGELTDLLKEAGITVNARAMPRLSLEQAKHYLSAELQVFYPNGAYETTYREVFEPLPIRSLRLDAPCGLEGSKKWLESLSSELGVKDRAQAAFQRAAKALAGDWDSARREASGHGLAFVVDASHVRRLTDPKQMWGIAVLRLLREMGFAVEVLCYGRVSKGGPALSFFQTREELGSLLREGRFEAVYSEYAWDSRLARAGKAQFALDSFELGLGGALRTVERLNGICRWPFYRRYSRYLEGS